MNRRAIFVVPAFNESSVILQTIKGIVEKGFSVLCIDDGSSDETYSFVQDIEGVIALRHCTNVGQGAALETGFEWVRRNLDLFDYVVTFDADGQHQVSDAIKMIDVAIDKQIDIVLGSRFLIKENASSIPRIKRIVLPLFAKIYARTKSMKISDRHNGLRVINTRKLESFKILSNDFSHADEILRIIQRNRISFVEFPVEIKYTSYSMAKGQPITNGITMLIDKLFRL